MNSLFEVAPKIIQALTEEPFVNVLNRLLRAEASFIGLLPVLVSTSLRTKEKDGGVDAEVRDCDQLSDWIPMGRSIWQFKSGDVTPAKIKNEFKPPCSGQSNDEVTDEATDENPRYLIEAFEDGASYILCIGDDLTPTKRKKREDAVRKCFEEKGLTPRFRVLTAHEIAQWASQHIAICYLPEFGKPLGGDFILWRDWADLPKFAQDFQPDGQRLDICRALRDRIERGNDAVHHRIEGLAGIGKTRLALEVFRPKQPNDNTTPSSDGLHDRVLYAQSPDDIPSGIFMWVSSHPDASLILVVDECGRDEMERLETQTQRCNGRMKLLTIGQAQQARAASLSRPDTFVLERLAPDAMRTLLQQNFEVLATEAVEFIVEKCSGFVKLAVALANAIIRHPERASARELLETQEVHEVISKYLVPDRTDQRVLQAVSLLSRVGWAGEVVGEGKAITAFMELTWGDAQMRVGQFVNEGFVAKQGRYRYVTPHLLAVWMASEVWKARDMETLNVVQTLPTLESRRALLERLYDLGDDPHAQSITGALLRNPQSFPDLDSISDEGRAEIFALLAQTNPQAGLQALQRLLEHLPRTRLLEFNTGRREIVHLLEKLAWLPDTFFGAARLLLQLADTENEAWGNNASGVWTGLFGTRLGGTAVPALDRHVLVREALNSDSANRNLLAVDAVRHILAWQETRFSAGYRQGGRLVSQEWRPKTIEEDRAVRYSGLALLDQALDHAVSEVRTAAQEALFDLARDLTHIGLADGVIERLERLPVTANDDRHKMRSAIEELSEFEAEKLTPEQHERLSALHTRIVGSSFKDRLRRWTGPITITQVATQRSSIIRFCCQPHGSLWYSESTNQHPTEDCHARTDYHTLLPLCRLFTSLWLQR